MPSGDHAGDDGYLIREIRSIVMLPRGASTTAPAVADSDAMRATAASVRVLMAVDYPPDAVFRRPGVHPSRGLTGCHRFGRLIFVVYAVEQRNRRIASRTLAFPLLKRLVACVLTIVAAGAVRTAADGLDLARSRITVHVYKSGLFSVFADNHIIEAKLREGSLSVAEPSAISIVVNAGDLRVLDPGLADDKRADVQSRMVGPEVLDVATYPEIRFASTSIRPSGADRWTITGDLTIHGRTRSITLAAARTAAVYRGSVRIRQRDFGITPISIVGGTVNVKDEILIEFEIVAAAE